MNHPTIRLVDVRETVLDVAEVLAALDHDAAGGVNLFIGAVRNHDQGRQVTHLEYTAHPTAVEELRAVAVEVAGEYDVLAMAVIHRTGRLAIGDAAVVTGVVAAHRGASFDANRELIDRLKKRVPIWKHQVFADGSDEWVGTP